MFMSEDEAELLSRVKAVEGFRVDEDFLLAVGSCAEDFACVLGKESSDSFGWVGDVKDASGGVGLGSAVWIAEDGGATDYTTVSICNRAFHIPARIGFRLGILMHSKILQLPFPNQLRHDRGHGGVVGEAHTAFLGNRWPPVVTVVVSGCLLCAFAIPVVSSPSAIKLTSQDIRILNNMICRFIMPLRHHRSFPVTHCDLGNPLLLSFFDDSFEDEVLVDWEKRMWRN